ncbi:MAG: hypothetical protein AAF360_19080 [Pseudomonadota bacterium]
MQALNSYEDWKQCITVACDIPLTADYVDQRLAALRDRGDLHTRKFVDQWGEAHLERVIGWFDQAKREVA